ncbi:MAG: IbrB-like domain-containing protein [Lactococcus petauri]
MGDSFISPAYKVMRVPFEKIRANEYNPNKVATPEFKLLKRSILEDGYTMPIVCYYNAEEGIYEIVDGFHRYLVMKNSEIVYQRENGGLPVSVIHKPLTDRIASTIRHNRARGTHSLKLMVDIVTQLVEAKVSDCWIMEHIGMDKEEILRLKQISGLTSLFQDVSFSQAWEYDEDDS